MRMDSDEPLDLSLNKQRPEPAKPQKSTSGRSMEIFSKLSVLMKHPKALQHLTKEKLLKIQNYKNILVCDICYKFFDRPSLLTRHVRSHTGLVICSFLSIWAFHVSPHQGKSRMFVVNATKPFQLPARWILTNASIRVSRNLMNWMISNEMNFFARWKTLQVRLLPKKLHCQLEPLLSQNDPLSSQASQVQSLSPELSDTRRFTQSLLRSFGTLPLFLQVWTGVR